MRLQVGGWLRLFGAVSILLWVSMAACVSLARWYGQRTPLQESLPVPKHGCWIELCLGTVMLLESDFQPDTQITRAARSRDDLCSSGYECWYDLTYSPKDSPVRNLFLLIEQDGFLLSDNSSLPLLSLGELVLRLGPPDYVSKHAGSPTIMAAYPAQWLWVLIIPAAHNQDMTRVHLSPQDSVVTFIVMHPQEEMGVGPLYSNSWYRSLGMPWRGFRTYTFWY
ncbi:MAG TPA: hypothetical protein VHP83_10480 [Aggregatilineaceae bacterium]|nr:hypothetical protein [Aggregatilineaceae bacterium]